MKCFINGQEIDSSSIGPPAMNFGQLWRYDGCPACRYRYLFTLNEFLERLEKWFEEFRLGEITLKEIEHNEEFPHLHLFRKLGFPTLPVMVDEYQYLLSELVRWDDQEVLEHLSELPKPSPIFYYANSLESLAIEPKNVVIEGVAFGIISAV